MLGVRASYDAVILGHGIPFLTSGLTLAKGGARVLMVPLKLRSYRAPLLEQQQTPYIEGAELINGLKHLGLTPADIRRLTRAPAGIQFIFADKRFTCTADRLTTQSELMREYHELSPTALETHTSEAGAASERAQKFAANLWEVDNLPPRNFRDQHRLKKLSREHQSALSASSQEFWQPMINALSLAFTNIVHTLPLPAGLTDRLLMLSQLGHFDARPLEKILTQAIKTRSAEFLGRGLLESIHCKRRIVDSIRIKGGDLANVQFKTLVLAAEPTRLLPYLDEETTWRPLHRMLSKQPALLDRYLLPVVVGEEGLPIGLEARAISITDHQAPLLNANFLHIDIERIERSKSVIWCHFLTEHDRGVDERLTRSVMEHLSRIIPFLEENQLTPYLPAQKIGELYEAKKSDSYFPFLGLAATTPYKNMLLAHKRNLPELGVEGELLAGIKTAELALKQIGRHEQNVVIERRS